MPTKLPSKLFLFDYSPKRTDETLVMSIYVKASVNCILLKERKGVKYGGSEHMVMFVELDCRVDVLCFAQLLKHRITEACGLRSSARCEQGDVSFLNCDLKDLHTEYDKDFSAACMRRFSYIRCYSTSEFLSTLKVNRSFDFSTFCLFNYFDIAKFVIFSLYLV